MMSGQVSNTFRQSKSGQSRKDNKKPTTRTGGSQETSNGLPDRREANDDIGPWSILLKHGRVGLAILSHSAVPLSLCSALSTFLLSLKSYCTPIGEPRVTEECLNMFGCCYR